MHEYSPPPPPEKILENFSNFFKKLEFVLIAPITYILLTFLALLINTAWVSDDAMISLAQVVNLHGGEGMVINHGERVQSFTHVTWFFLIALVTGITGEYYLTVMLTGVLCTLGALYTIHDKRFAGNFFG